MRSKLWTGIFACIGMLVLILDTKTALQGGLDGLRICLMSVIPSLFPFFILTGFITSAISGTNIKLLQPIRRLCRMSPGSEPLFLLGLLGGYPTGAQSIAQSYADGILSKKDAQRLLGFCSNAGPSFLFGIAAAAFDKGYIAWVLWGIHILSAVVTAIVLPGGSNEDFHPKAEKPLSFPRSVERSIWVMAKVCGWIITFRIILAFFQRWFLWLFPVELQVLFCGALELANGCLQLNRIDCPGLRFVICEAILSFGGLSVLMQTVSVTGNLGLGMYLPGKILQCGISVIASLFFQQMLFPSSDQLTVNILFLIFLAVIPPAIMLILRNKEKRGSNSAAYRV